MGISKDDIAQHWDVLMKFLLFQPPNIQWLVGDIAEVCTACSLGTDIDTLVEMVAKAKRVIIF